MDGQALPAVGVAALAENLGDPPKLGGCMGGQALPAGRVAAVAGVSLGDLPKLGCCMGGQALPAGVVASLRPAMFQRLRGRVLETS